MTIAIGVVFGGPETTPFKTALNVVEDIICERRRHVFPREGICVNVVYLVPGSVVKHGVPFEGVRVRRFSRKAKTIIIEVAVPPDIVYSDSSESFVVATLKEAVRLAGCSLEQRGIEFDSDKHLMFVGQIEDQLR